MILPVGSHDARRPERRKSCEKFLLADCRNWSEAFVDEAGCRRKMPPATWEAWEDAVPELVRCPPNGSHTRRGGARSGQGRAHGGSGGPHSLPVPPPPPHS